jgi:peptide subunit release factor 1 (eRF1)
MSMQTSDVTHERLQRLAALDAPADCRVLSLYLNLDPRDGLGTGPGRRTAVTSLLDEAERSIEGVDGLSHKAHMALREDVGRAREFLEGGERDGWAEGAQGLALFLCGPADVFEVVRLPRPVAQRVLISDRPSIEPLAEVGTAEQWAVLVLDGDNARLLEGIGDRLEEAKAIEDERVSARGGKGGWSSQRFSRSLHKEEVEHVRNAAEMLVDCDRRRRYRRIYVGTTSVLFSELERHVDQQTRQRIVGRFDAGADWESPADIYARVQPLLEQDEIREEREALEHLPLAGVRGFRDTLQALYERRVRILLLAPAVERPGVVCPRCRWAEPEGRATCPVDGVEMRPHPNLAEWAVESAVEQVAEIVIVRHHDELRETEGIAAVRRF